MDSYEKATKEPFTYLFVDLRMGTDERLRLRGDILAKYPAVFLDKKLCYLNNKCAT